MMILTANQLPTDIVDTPVDDFVKVYKLCQEMKEVCHDRKGKGLSAVQVGVPWKLFVVADLPGLLRIGNDPFGYFVNCEYEPIGDQKFDSIEGCLSIRNADGSFRHFRVTRHYKIRVSGKRLVDLDLIDFDQVLDVKTDAVAFQHEIDHHRGVLISDAGREILLW